MRGPAWVESWGESELADSGMEGVSARLFELIWLRHATGRGARESVWIRPARRHARSVQVAGRGGYLAIGPGVRVSGAGCLPGEVPVMARTIERDVGPEAGMKRRERLASAGPSAGGQIRRHRVLVERLAHLGRQVIR